MVTFIAEITEVTKLASFLYSYVSSRRVHTSVTNCLFIYLFLFFQIRFMLIFNEIIGLNIDFAQLSERRNQLYKITNLNFIFYCNLFFI